jgi:hypothetical protein
MSEGPLLPSTRAIVRESERYRAPEIAPVPELKRRNSQNSKFFFPSAEVATAYRNVKNKGAASPTTSRFAESVNNIEIAQNELVDALVSVFISHMSAKKAWTSGDIDNLLNTRLDLDRDKKSLRDVFNNVNKFLTIKKDPNFILTQIHEALHATEIPNEHQASVSHGGQDDVYAFIYNTVKSKIDSNSILVSKPSEQKYVSTLDFIPRGGKKHRTHRAKRTHRKKHRTHRKKHRTHRKTRKN